MKNKNIIILFILSYMAFGACTENEWKEIENILPGYSASIDTLNSTIVITKNHEDNSVVFEEINIDLQFEVNSLLTDVKTVGINKSIYDESSNRIATASLVTQNNVEDPMLVQLTSVEELFADLNYEKDSIRSGYYFVFSPYIEKSNGDTIVTSEGNFTLKPEYYDFCTLPAFPQGLWEAHNKQTGFKKYVEVKYIEVMTDVWFWVITDFGIDWSNWNDYWYGTAFYLECPFAGDNRFVVRLSAWGIDLPHITYEMKNDDGVLETRPLRLMPWRYEDEANTGFYDAENKQFVFQNVGVIDTWWNADNHLIEDVTITYVGEQ